MPSRICGLGIQSVENILFNSNTSEYAAANFLQWGKLQ